MNLVNELLMNFQFMQTARRLFVSLETQVLNWSWNNITWIKKCI